MIQRCDQCVSATINGVFTHEHGCPDHWKGIQRKCRACDREFYPEYRDELLCSTRCTEEYWGLTPGSMEDQTI